MQNFRAVVVVLATTTNQNASVALICCMSIQLSPDVVLSVSIGTAPSEMKCKHTDTRLILNFESYCARIVPVFHCFRL